ncbi:MAG: fibronectin type III domain-containing protein [Candidatus Moranbacteria bacterium]|nr:fibronectin type III domain-containing protein [Candidatus Moranbacteria bacterium]
MKKKFFRPIILIFAVCFSAGILSFGVQAKAATITWNGATSSVWSLGSNWVGGVVPAATDDVVINGGYANAPNLDLTVGAVTINSLSIGSSAGSTLTIYNGDMSTKKLIVNNDLTVGASGVLTHAANSTMQTHVLNLQVGGNMTIATGGKIDVNGRGFTGVSRTNGYGPGAGVGSSGWYGGGAGYGGNGGSGTGYAGGSSYGSVFQPIDIGSSGGGGNGDNSGSGGGGVRIVVFGTFTINGSIVANGGAGYNYAGGGSGGSIWITTGTLSGVGTLTSNGGNAGGSNSGAASGGRITIEYTSSTFAGSKTAFGGTNGYQNGAAGTIYTKQGSANGNLLIDNNNISSVHTQQAAGTNFTFDNVTITRAATYIIPNTSTMSAMASLSGNGANGNVGINSGGTLNLPTATFTLSFLTVTNNGIIGTVKNLTLASSTFYQNGSFSASLTDLTVGTSSIFEFQNLNTSTAFNLNNLTIQNGGSVTHAANGSIQANILNLNIANNLDIQTGGKIDISGKGYIGRANASGYGPGAGVGSSGWYGGGAGYGAAGGSDSHSGGTSGGSPYGSVFQPTDIGSSGGGGSGFNNLGGSGGGGTRIVVAGVLNLNGSIIANGAAGSSNSGGGSGGSIWITTGTLSGGGTATSNGGNAGNNNAGSGSGGRIAIEYVASTFSGTKTAFGGTGGYQNGGVGTIRTGSTSADIVSSPYDTSSPQNVIGGIIWHETIPAGTDVRFQLRSAPDNAGSPGIWTGWMGPDGTSATFFTDPTGGETIPSVLRDGNSDQWIQYKVTLTSTSLAANPILSDVTLNYAVNVSPQFDASFGTNGVLSSQISDNADANWGKFKIQYAIKDVDAASGNVTRNYVTPSFEYSYDGTNWNTINLSNVTFAAPNGGNVTDINLDGKIDNEVLEGGYLTYAAFWDAKAQIPENYSANIHIRVTINDNEIVNNIVAATSNVTNIDTKNPILGAVPVKVDATTDPSLVTMDAIDDSALQMKVSTSPIFSGTNWEAYASQKTITLASEPTTVYVQIRDSYGNISPILSAKTPEVPTNMMIQDTSNMRETPVGYRLFVAWKVVAAPSDGFASYKIYRSSDQLTWSLVGTITDRLTNYFGDNSVANDANFYYRVITSDNDGNVSANSAIVNGKADGVQDAGEGGGGAGTIVPTISNVTVDQISTTSARIKWTTDTLSTSTVGFSTTQANFAAEQGVGSMVTSHDVTLFGLTPNTQYYFQAKSSDASNMLTADNNGGNGYAFTTSAGDNIAPTISGITSSAVTANSATISWDTDEAATEFVEFSKTDGFSQGAFFGDYLFATTHSVILQSLEGNTNYYFKVHSKDASNNEQISSQQTFKTEPSGDIVAPIISNVNVVPSFNSASFSWDTDEGANSYIEYGTTSSYGRIYGDNNFNISHSVQIPYDLDQETTYHYRVHSADAAKNETVSADSTFTTTRNPADMSAPVISSISIGAVTSTSAAVTWLTDEPATSHVGYSIDNGNSFSEQGSSQLTTFHSVTVVGLDLGATYYLRIVSVDASKNTAIDDNAGAYYIISTPQGPQPPTLMNIAASSLTFDQAIITWNTNIAANSFVEYGLDANYGSAIGKYANETSHSITLTNLLPNSTYHYRVRSTKQVENVSGDNTFMTAQAPDATPLAISTIASGGVTSSAVTITWNTNKDTDSVIHYGNGNSYTKIARNQGTASQTHSVDISNLTPGTTYDYQIVSTDDSGSIAFSTNQNFTTMNDTEKPVFSDLSILATTQSTAVIAWKTDKISTTKISYGKDHDLKNSLQTSLVNTEHYISLNNLEAGTKYYYKIEAVDFFGNAAISSEQTFYSNVDESFNHDPLKEITFNVKNPTLLTDTDSVITFDTDQSAECILEYWEDALPEIPTVPLNEEVFSTSHNMHLSKLKYSTKYDYKVYCHDNLKYAQNIDGKDVLDYKIIASNQNDFTTKEKMLTGTQWGSDNAVDGVSPVINNVKASNVTGESATITWDTDEKGSSTVGWGVNDVNENGSNNQLVNSTTGNYVTNHTVLVNGLIPATKYIFVAVSLDASGNISQSSQSSFTTASPSSLSSIKAESKSLGEAVITWKTSQQTSSTVEYGLSTSYGEKKENNTLSSDHTISLSNLTQGMVYHYRVKGQDADGKLYASSDQTFEPKSPAEITSISISEISEHGATVNFKTSVPTDANVSFTDVKDNHTTGSQGSRELATDHKIKLSNLLQGTTFSIMIAVRDEQGTESTMKAPDLTTGQDTTPPEIVNVKTDSALTQSDKVQTIISWKTNEQATTSILYKEGMNGEEKELKISDNPTISHIVVITIFKPGTVYDFMVKSVDASGNESISNNFALLTPKKKENIIQIIIGDFAGIFGWVHFN